MKTIRKALMEYTSMTKYIDINDLLDSLIKNGYLKSKEIEQNEKPTHGECCCCQACGRYHDDCICEDNELLKLINDIPYIKIHSY